MGLMKAAVGWVTAWTAVGMAVLGYHPYAEDGGLYVAEIKHAIDPALYPWDPEFVTGHLGFGLFTDAVVWLVRSLGMRLEWVLLGLDVACLWGMLLGVWLIAGRCFGDRRAQIGAVGLVAVWLGVPVGGTSLYIADPYVTARSVAVALTVLGVAAGMRRRWGWAGAAAGAALAVHPLMGGYGLVELAVLWCVAPGTHSGRVAHLGRDEAAPKVGHDLVQELGHPVWLAVLWAGALVGAGVVQGLAPMESADSVRVAITRYYWFLSQWQWFEWLGLVAPLAILGVAAVKARQEGVRTLARMAGGAGGLGVVVALLFAREGAAVHLVARMQPLRMLQMVYLAMTVVIGGVLGERVLKGSAVRWVGAFGVMAGVMVWVARSTYPGSNALELPGVTPKNAWVRAFGWIRENTPKEAHFAIDANYVHWDGEDAQGFRAIAERSVLPDAAKDGGIASIRPELVWPWVVGSEAQDGLTRKGDAERIAALTGRQVDWVVLGREGVTGFVCPYENERLKVCRLPER